MPPLQRRRGRRRGVGWALSVATTLSLIGLAAPSQATGDDYPYAGLGQCPLVPLPKQHKPATKPLPGPPHGPLHGSAGQPGNPGSPGSPGDHGAGKPGSQPGSPTAPPKPAAPPPPRQCAKHIWLYNGSYGDPWGFALRNCTSFVAWRLRMTNGLTDFGNQFGGVSWGNASHWDEAAAQLGYVVDDVPALGAVAQTDAGAHGHVAWVSAVSPGTVTVEEYNYAVAGGYDVRTLPASTFTYLHLDDVAPAPYLGSTRSGVATTDGHGGTWSVRTTSAGQLDVHRPLGRLTRLHVAGGWSPTAAPAVTTDAQDRVWVAAVSAAGRVLAAHTRVGTRAFTRPRPVLPGATTSSPALVVDGDGRVRVVATTPAGTLLERHTQGSRTDRWSRPHQMGRPGSWSTHAAPAATADVNGAVWVAAVTRNGALLAQHSTRRGRGWSGLRLVDHREWSATSSPALLGGADGRVWLASVGSRGDLVIRHSGTGKRPWERAHGFGGRWSPYSSPSLTTDPTGRLWLAAVRAGGRLTVTSTRAGELHWRASRGVHHGPGSETMSPGLTYTVGGVLVTAIDPHGRTVWRRPLGPSGLAAAQGPRGGGFSLSRFL